MQAQQLQGGIRAGGNVSSGVGADAHKSSLLFRYHAGLTGRLAFTSRLSLHPEVLYTVKGDGSLAYGPSLQAQLSYLEIPVLARYTLGGGAFVEGGPYAARLLSYRFQDVAMRVTDPVPFQRQDYGLVLSFGYQDPGGFSISWRYEAGLRNVFRPVDLAGEIEQVRMRNGTVQFTLGYLLPWSWGQVN